MIERILEKLSPSEITELLDYFGSKALTRQVLKIQQINYAKNLLKNNSTETAAKRLVFMFNISRTTAYRRVNLAKYHNDVSYETELCNTDSVSATVTSRSFKYYK